MRDELESLAARFRDALQQDPAPDLAPEPVPEPAADAQGVRLVIAPRVKCDLLAYSGLHCGGQLMLVRVMPRGEAQGELLGDLQSIMIAGPLGTRVVFATGAGEDWQDHPWRAVVLTAGHTFTARNGKPAVRIPDLDSLDRPDARRADATVQESFPGAPSLDEGTGWTYGRPGPIRNRVRQVFVDKIGSW